MGADEIHLCSYMVHYFTKTWHRSKSSTAFWHEEQIFQFYLWQEMEDLTMFHLLFVWLKPLQFLLQRTPFPSAWNLLDRSWTVLLKIRSVWNIICCLNKKLPEDPVNSLWQRLVRVSWCTLVSYYFPTLFFCPPMVSCWRLPGHHVRSSFESMHLSYTGCPEVLACTAISRNF